VERFHVDFTHNGLEDFRDIGGLNPSGNQVLGSAKDEILNQEQINLVPVGRKLFRLVQVALQKEAQSFHARHSGGDEEMPKVDGLYLAVHLIQPLQVAFARFFV
jgi:hypothetical protein